MLLLHYYASPGGKGVQRTRSYGRSGGANRKPRERAREHPSTGARLPAPHLEVEDAHVGEGEEDLVDEVDARAVLGDQPDEEAHHDPPPVQLLGPRHPAHSRPCGRSPPAPATPPSPSRPA